MVRAVSICGVAAAAGCGGVPDSKMVPVRDGARLANSPLAPAAACPPPRETIAAVAKIILTTWDETGRHDVARGTGVLVGDSYLLTNNHVLSTPDQAGRATIYFDQLADSPRGAPERLDPVRFWATSTMHDWTVVRFAGEPCGARHSIPLCRGSRCAGTVEQAVVDSTLTILQYPTGGSMQCASGRLLSVAPVQLLYALDYAVSTDHGSSGAPVFDAQWNLEGIHREEGEKDGGAPTYNEGIPIGPILDELEKEPRWRPTCSAGTGGYRAHPIRNLAGFTIPAPTMRASPGLPL